MCKRKGRVIIFRELGISVSPNVAGRQKSIPKSLIQEVGADGGGYVLVQGQLLEAGAGRGLALVGDDLPDAGGAGASLAAVEHAVHGRGLAREHGLHGPVRHVPHPPAHRHLLRLLARPRQKVHALHLPPDHHVHLLMHSHSLSQQLERIEESEPINQVRIMDGRVLTDSTGFPCGDCTKVATPSRSKLCTFCCSSRCLIYPSFLRVETWKWEHIPEHMLNSLALNPPALIRSPNLARRLK